MFAAAHVARVPFEMRLHGYSLARRYGLIRRLARIDLGAGRLAVNYPRMN
jgi:hypothetical protein